MWYAYLYIHKSTLKISLLHLKPTLHHQILPLYMSLCMIPVKTWKEKVQLMNGLNNGSVGVMLSSYHPHALWFHYKTVQASLIPPYFFGYPCICKNIQKVYKNQKHYMASLKSIQIDSIRTLRVVMRKGHFSSSDSDWGGTLDEKVGNHWVGPPL